MAFPPWETWVDWTIYQKTRWPSPPKAYDETVQYSGLTTPAGISNTYSSFAMTTTTWKKYFYTAWKLAESDRCEWRQDEDSTGVLLLYSVLSLSLLSCISYAASYPLTCYFFMSPIKSNIQLPAKKTRADGYKAASFPHSYSLFSLVHIAWITLSVCILHRNGEVDLWGFVSNGPIKYAQCGQ